MKIKNIFFKIITIFIVIGCGDNSSFDKSDKNITNKKENQKQLIVKESKQLNNKIDKSEEKEQKIDTGILDDKNYSEEAKPLNELMDEERIKVEENNHVPDEEVDDIVESKSEEEISDEELSNIDNQQLSSDSDDKSNIQTVNSKSEEELEDEKKDK